MLFVGRILSAFCAIGAFVSQFAAPATAEERIGIGVIAPLSGLFAPLGESLVQGARAAAERLNASHGIMDKRIEIISFDDAGSPPRAVEQARRAVESERLQFVIGHLTQATSVAASRVYAERKVLQIEPRGSRMPSDAPGGETLFNLCGAEGTSAEVAKKYLAKRFNADAVGIVGEDDNISRSVSSHLSDAFKKAGNKVVASESTDTKSILSGINRIEAQGAKAAIVNLLPNVSYTSKLTDVSNASTKIPVIVDVPASVTPGYVPLGGASSVSSWLFLLQEVDQSVGIAQPPPDLARFRAQSVYASNSFLLGYAGVQVIAKGAEEARSFDSIRVAAWLRSGRAAPTILGDVNFDGVGQGSISRFAIYGFGRGSLRPDGTEVTCDSGCPCKDGGCGCACPKK